RPRDCLLDGATAVRDHGDHVGQDSEIVDLQRNAPWRRVNWKGGGDVVRGLDRIIGERAFGRALVLPDREFSHAQERRDIKAVACDAELLDLLSLTEPLNEFPGCILVSAERPDAIERLKAIDEPSFQASGWREVPALG